MISQSVCRPRKICWHEECRCEPDPDSRSSADGGARLVLIDPEHRDWGWSVVNHGTYRERARLAAKNAAEVESGKNRGRMSDRRGPPETAANRPSDKTKQDKTKDKTDGSRPQPSPIPPSFHDEVIAAYHELCPDLPRVKVWSDKRRRSLNARIREHCARGKPADSIEYWRSLFREVAQSDFLCGRTKDPFRCSLGWILLSQDNFAKVIEGNYSNRHGNGA
jgi:hypothetical protein